ncbi:MAG: hypothetical protein IPK31_09185 [Chitinophagaceae bacterium]|nr:hypothetical protein [Chitinophagaceae bacterium]
MKRLLLGLFALMFVISLSAFHHMNSKKENKAALSFTWHKYMNDGSAELVPAVTFTGTEAQARIEFGCPEDDDIICARAYDDEGTPQSLYILKANP